jgi:hypothetical protein
MVVCVDVEGNETRKRVYSKAEGAYARLLVLFTALEKGLESRLGSSWNLVFIKSGAKYSFTT